MQPPHQPHFSVEAAATHALLHWRGNAHRIATQKRTDNILLIGLPPRRQLPGTRGGVASSGRAGKVASWREIISGACTLGDLAIEAASAKHYGPAPARSLAGNKPDSTVLLTAQDRCIGRVPGRSRTKAASQRVERSALAGAAGERRASAGRAAPASCSGLRRSRPGRAASAVESRPDRRRTRLSHGRRCSNMNERGRHRQDTGSPEKGTKANQTAKSKRNSHHEAARPTIQPNKRTVSN